MIYRIFIAFAKIFIGAVPPILVLQYVLNTQINTHTYKHQKKNKEQKQKPNKGGGGRGRKREKNALNTSNTLASEWINTSTNIGLFTLLLTLNIYLPAGLRAVVYIYSLTSY